jgi:hypothetical protein
MAALGAGGSGRRSLLGPTARHSGCRPAWQADPRRRGRSSAGSRATKLEQLVADDVLNDLVAAPSDIQTSPESERVSASVQIMTRPYRRRTARPNASTAHARRMEPTQCSIVRMRPSGSIATMAPRLQFTPTTPRWLAGHRLRSYETNVCVDYSEPVPSPGDTEGSIAHA